ncbi:MAG: HAMP domain-containing histidine kinase [Eubacterium sp.]|nr:HAMP domain-containing histidine kinase [Eubacterium sp.]
MKKLRGITIAFVLLMAAVLTVLLILAGDMRFEKRNISEYNDRIIRISEEYEAGQSVEELEQRYGCQIIFSKELLNAELAKYYGRKAMILDFMPGGKYLGKVVWDDSAGDYEVYRSRFLRTALILWGLLLLAGILLIIYIYLRMVKPVKELSAYSTEIARGNLDVPLPIRKNGLSDSFTESFDLMREELKAAREREAAAEKAKKELVAELSHDIKTPVATIQATCEVLEMKNRRKLESAVPGQSLEVTEEELKDMTEKVKTISVKTETINQIMGNVFQATMNELEQIRVNPREESSVWIETFFMNLKNYGKIIQDNRIPQCLVLMDKLRMEQVIDNVVGNSHKYAGTDIHVSFDETGDASNTFIRIRISDSGPGVDEDELPLITEKYYRGTAAKDKSGYGVGMYLVKSYMEMQGGGVEYYNDNGFVVELYLKKV